MKIRSRVHLAASLLLLSASSACSETESAGPDIQEVTQAVTSVIEVRVATGSDDAEESATGSVSLTSTDLEFVRDGSASPQLPAMRFTALDIPAGATITKAYVEFTTDETSSADTEVFIRAEDVDDAAGFTTAMNSISNRPLTSQSVTWTPDPWNTVGELHQSSDISSLVQAVVNRSGWTPGNDMVIVVSGDGQRIAESYNGSANDAPLLHVEYDLGPAVCGDSACNGEESCSSCESDCGACPTCSDGVQNQSEAGVDCGGPCEECEGGPASLWLEAEGGTLSGSPAFSVVSDSGATGGAYLSPTSNNTGSPGPNRVTYNVSVAAGTYRIWGRVIAPNGGDDSFWVSVDGGSFIKWNSISRSSSWLWDEVHDSNSQGRVVDFNFAAGSHSIEIANRENGVKLDKIYLSSLGDTPSGEGGSTSLCVEGSSQSGTTPCGLNNRGTFLDDCTGDAWVTSATCSDPDECSDSASQAGTTACGLNGNGLLGQVCSVGSWTDTSDCVDPDLCVNDATQAGTTACGFNNAGALALVCAGGVWIDSSTCVNLDICTNGQEQTGTTSCGINGDGLLEQVCASGAWGDASDCVDDDVCTNAATQTGSTPCGLNGNGSLDEVCVSGNWGDSATCVDSDLCQNGATQAGTSLCGLNGRGALGEICALGAWEDATTCVDPDECTDGASESGSSACGLNGNGLIDRTCLAGSWSNSGECVDPDSCVNGASQPGTTTCGLNDRGQLDEICASGTWGDSGICADPDVCTDNAERTGTIPCGINDDGLLDQLCVSGAWGDTETCVDDDLCENGTERPGTTACGFNSNGLLEQECSAGTWGDSSTCEDTDECENGTSQLGTTPCGLNERGAVLSDCTEGSWVESAVCEDNDECLDGDVQAGSAPCGFNGNGTSSELCTLGSWEVTLSCDDPDLCENGDVQSVSCGAGGESTLDQTCSTGQWQDSSECIECGNGVCSETESCFSCSADCGACLTESIRSRVSTGSDDAEENIGTGRVGLTSSDLELVEERNEQIVGMRFSSLNVPAGTIVSNAYIEFTVDETSSSATNLFIQGQSDDDPATFTTATRNISSRALTEAGVSWSPGAWNTVGTVWQTPDLSEVVQEIIDRPGWEAQNAMVMIVSGAGKRVAESYNGVSGSAARLVIEYETEPLCGNGTCDNLESCGTCAQDCGECADTLKVAVIGDFGWDDTPAAEVGALVASWDPDHVITVGDNNYTNGEASTIDVNIGQFYSNFIGEYQGSYGSGSERNRFWPSLGNHDWYTTAANPYLDYFTLPTGAGSERYYEMDLGIVSIFSVDSDAQEPDGIIASSVQGQWLQGALTESDSCFNLVYMHHSPYSSGEHGSETKTQWPYASWGADAVLSGHDHNYERLEIDGNPNVPYIVNGLGGRSIRTFPSVLPQSESRYIGDYGAMLITAQDGVIQYQFYDIQGALIDDYSVNKSCP